MLLHTPGLVDLHAIVRTYFAKLNCAPGLSLERVAATLHALQASASEAESFVRTAFTTALREAIESVEIDAAECSEGRRRELQAQGRQVTQRHVDAALEDLLRRNDLIEIDEEEVCLTEAGENDSITLTSSTTNNPAISAPTSAFAWSGGGFSTGI